MGTCISNALFEKSEFYSVFLGYLHLYKFYSSFLKNKIVKRYVRVGYNVDVMRQSACLVLNPITVYSYGFLFNSTTVGQTSDYDGSDVKL